MSSNSIDSTDSPKSISKVVSNHADRVMDELFADIEGLLSGDSQERHSAASGNKISSQNIPQQPTSQTYPQLPPDMRVHGNSHIEQPTAVTATVVPKKNTWKIVLASLSVVALAVGGGAWWLNRQGKLDMSKLQLPSLNSAANGDVQFSDYLRRAMNKVDIKAAPTNQVSIPNPPAASTSAQPTTQQSGVVGTVNLARVIPGSPPMAEFSIDGKLQQLRGGDKIGNTGWMLTTVINTVDNEVIVKKDNGEMRSLKVGQGF
jgi:hypothetical protein